jgi:cell division septum initiation protein DivIVA
MTVTKNKYSNEYIERTIRHYERMAEEIEQLRISNEIYKCQVQRLEKKLLSLGADPAHWQSFPM